MRLVDDPSFNPPPSQSLEVSLGYLTSLLPQEWLVRVGIAANRYEADGPGRSISPCWPERLRSTG